MEKTKYECACGFGRNNLKEFRSHLLRSGLKEKGKHRSLKIEEREHKLMAQVDERLTEAPPSRVKTKKKVDKKWLLVFGGILLVVLGCAFSFYIYSHSRNNPVFILGLFAIVPGVVLVFRGWRTEGGDTVPSGAIRGDRALVKPKGNENCLNIYPPDLGGIKFEHADTPAGLPWKCENDGKWYFVNIWDQAKKGLIALVLPDTQYYDPKEFANIVGAEPIKRFFEMHFQTLEKLAPWLFIAMIGLMILAMIILPGVLGGG